MKKHILQVHEKVRPYECIMCDGKFSGQNQLTVHIETVHEGKKKHQCPICNAKFARRHDVTQHLMKIHESSDDKPHSCTQCDATFKVKSHLYTKFYLHSK